MANWLEENRPVVFVSSPGHSVGLIIGQLDAMHVRLLTPNGDVVRRPISWCEKINLPEEGGVCKRRTEVYVTFGRLEGMYGTVIGSTGGQVFVRTSYASLPLHINAILEWEWKVFVENVICLAEWGATG